MPSEYRPRLSVEISDHQMKKLNDLIPWGLKSHIFSTIIDDLIEALEKHGSMLLAAIIDNKIKLEDYTRIKAIQALKREGFEVIDRQGKVVSSFGGKDEESGGI